MNGKRIWKWAYVSLVLMLVGPVVTVGPAVAQGYGGLGTQAHGFDVPSRATSMQFPKDHGSHPGFRIEWWYLTANLQSDDGTNYGIQWTLFRSALQPPSATPLERTSNWSAQQLWMGHAAVTTPTAHYVSETRARGVLGLAGVQSTPFKAWINDWQLTARSPEEKTINHLGVSASGERFSYQLDLTATGPLIFHGDKGYSVKSATGQASHYYSQPHYQVSGQLNLPDGPINVSGSAWLDREWSSQPLAGDQSGWDWVSVNLDDGSKLMGFRLRGGGGGDSGGDVYTSATWISPTGETIAYPNGKLKMAEISRSKVAGKSLPTSWRVQLADQNIDLEIEALNKNAWMSTSFPYWEGPVVLRGSHSGRGYLEMTGYQ